MTALAEQRRGRHGGGRPRKYPVRCVLGAILYVARTGCQWRALPINFPPWLSCHQQFRAWRDSGLWERINAELVRQSRLRQGRQSTPTAAIINSQSAKTAPKRGQSGYDAGKRIKGSKRHIAVDRDGQLSAAVVHSASIQDSAGARSLLPPLAARQPTVCTVYADGDYQGTLLERARDTLRISMSIIIRTLHKVFRGYRNAGS